VLLRRNYRSYGELLGQTGTHTESLGYIGQRTDAETANGTTDDKGLTYLHARYYDSSLGMFVSPDPISADSNSYRYSSNDPANRGDPSGLVDQTIPAHMVLTFLLPYGLDFLQEMLAFQSQHGGTGSPGRQPVTTPASDTSDDEKKDEEKKDEKKEDERKDEKKKEACKNAEVVQKRKAVVSTVVTMVVSASGTGGRTFANEFVAHASGYAAAVVDFALTVGPYQHTSNFFVSAERSMDLKLTRGVSTQQGNQNFGTVAAAFGFSRLTAQSGAGIAQMITGDAPGQGIPFLVFPYGDEPADAADVGVGHNLHTSGGCAVP
jgi:RHS repeat-associated protein